MVKKDIGRLFQGRRHEETFEVSVLRMKQEIIIEPISSSSYEGLVKATTSDRKCDVIGQTFEVSVLRTKQEIIITPISSSSYKGLVKATTSDRKCDIIGQEV